MFVHGLSICMRGKALHLDRFYAFRRRADMQFLSRPFTFNRGSTVYIHPDRFSIVTDRTAVAFEHADFLRRTYVRNGARYSGEMSRGTCDAYFPATLAEHLSLSLLLPPRDERRRFNPNAHSTSRFPGTAPLARKCRVPRTCARTLVSSGYVALPQSSPSRRGSAALCIFIGALHYPAAGRDAGRMRGRGEVR